MQQQFSKCDPSPQRSLRPLQGVHEVKTIFVIIPRRRLPFHTLLLLQVLLRIFQRLPNMWWCHPSVDWYACVFLCFANLSGGLPWRSSGEDPEIPLQGARVQSLVGELLIRSFAVRPKMKKGNHISFHPEHSKYCCVDNPHKRKLFSSLNNFEDVKRSWG